MASAVFQCDSCGGWLSVVYLSQTSEFPTCKACVKKKRGEKRDRAKAQRLAGGDWQEEGRLLRRWEQPKGRWNKYNLDHREFESMLRRQEGKCAICDRKPPEGKVLVIDHNHKTGDVRGLLCGSCNTALGMLQDDTEVLTRAISYLRSDERRSEKNSWSNIY